MIYRSRNYVELEELNKEQLCAVKCTTHLPCTIIERCAVLLYDFIDRYISTDEARAKLVSDVELFPEIITAHLNSILDHLDDSAKMLSECQDIEETIE